MEDNNRVPELERKMADLEKQIEILKQELQHPISQGKVRLEELEVEQIRVVEKDGTLRMSIHNQQRMPGPPTRKSGPDAGMLFFAEDGEEVGGLSFNDTQGLTFDQHHSDQVVGLVNSGVVKGLYVWDRPPGSLSDFIERFEEEHGRKPLVQELEFTRVFSGRWMNGEAKISLADRKGRERLRLLVDSTDTPRIEMLDENGEVLHTIAPEDFKPLQMPSTKSVPKNFASRTPAHMLGIFGDDIDKTLTQLDEARNRMGEEIYTSWRDWLLEAKRMNAAEEMKGQR